MWSSMPCCVGMEIGNLQGAPHVWDQARRRMTQLPTSSLQGESGLLLQKNLTPCSPHDQGRRHKQGKTQRCPGDLHGAHPIWAIGPLPSVWLLAQLSQGNERRHWVGRSRLISALVPQATHSLLLYFIQGSPHSTGLQTGLASCDMRKPPSKAWESQPTSVIPQEKDPSAGEGNAARLQPVGPGTPPAPSRRAWRG